MLTLGLTLLSTQAIRAQISLPYTEDFSGITAANGFPSPSGGAWARTGSTTLQPTYIANQSTYNRFGRGDTKFMSFRYGQPTGGNVYTVGTFSLSAGTTYRVSVWYITDGSSGFGPLSLTYGTGTTVALQSNTIASIPANITNTTYAQLSGTFSPATSGSYYIGIKCEANSSPWYLSIDDFSVVPLTACTGTPVPGTTLASSNPACSNAPITLSLSNSFASFTGVTYQWETSTNGTTWSPVTTGGTGSTYTATQSSATYYRATVTCTNSTSSATSTSVFVTQNPATSCYCVPVSTATGYYINNFATTGGVANISNLASGDAITSGGYSNYLTQTVSAYPGNSVNFTGSFGSSTSYTFGTKIYVDWNQDGDFTGANETVYATTGYTSSISGSFTVPATALTGPTRMRVRADYLNGTGPASCGSIADGEAEDYTFNVLLPPPCSGTPAAAIATAYAPVALTGFNADIIANGVGAPNTTATADVDGGGYYLLDSSYLYTSTSAQPTYALPISGVINSIATPGLSFKLRNPDSTNSLRIATTSGSGTLTLASPIAATNLYLLATSGSGAATVDVTVTFTTSATQTFTGLTIPDWYGGTPFAAQGIGRVTSTNTQDGTATNPRLYQLSLPISAANAGLNIASITVTRTSTAGYVQVMAVSASTQTPAGICSGNTRTLSSPGITGNFTGISYQWQESSSATGPFTNVTTGAGGTTLTYTTPVLSATKYYVLKTTCAATSLSSFSDTVAVTVNPSPTLTLGASPSTAAICGTSGSVTLSASGTGTSYKWTPATGLSSTTTANPVATPTQTTTYTVVSTSNNGCTSTASKTVGVFPTATTITAKTASAAVCLGGTTTLSAVDTNFGSSTAPTGYTNGTVTYPTTDEDFGSISFGGLSNTTACGSLVGTLGTATGTSGSYSNFAGVGTPANFQAGSSYFLSLSSITCGTTNYSNAMAVYIDYNQNGSFTDAGETVYLASGTISGPHTDTSTILIPASAKPGVTRLRVIVNESSVPSGPQMNPSYGEIEDYTIRIFKTGTIIPASGYAWSPSTFLSTTTGSPTTVTGITAATTYTVTGTDSNGCPATSGSVSVNVNPLPNIGVSPAVAAYCSGGSVSLTASGASTYAWSPNTSLSATSGATVTASPAITTTYVITGTDANGCVNTATKTVTVNPLPTINISPSTATAICTGSSVSLTASGGSTYSWTPAGSLSASTGATVTASPTGTVTYTVQGTDANGCVNSATKVVTVNSLPTIAISPSTTVAFCAGSSATLTASGATTYSWTPATGLSATSGTSVTASPTATTTYTVTGTDGNGCQNTATKLVTVNQLPNVAVSPSTATAVCLGQGVSLTASGAVTYAWTPSSGLSATSGATVTATPTGTTTYTVTGTDGNGCVKSVTKTVTVNPLPIIGITPATTTTICSGNSVTLTANGGTSYSWTPSTGLSSTTTASVSASPGATTTYTVTGTDANGCQATATKTVNVNLSPTVSISPALTTSICIGGSTTLTANGAITYSWTPATGLSSTTAATVTATPTTTTTYGVTGTAANGCTATAATQVVVNPLPNITVSPAIAAVCLGSSVTLTANGANTYTWSPSGSLSSSTGSSVSAFPSTATTYTITGTDVNGCIRTVTKTVTVNSLPTVSISPSGSIAACAGASTTLTASGAISYSWSPSTGLSSTTGATVTASPVSTQTYGVVGTDANGCIGSANKTITVNPLPVINISPLTAVSICAGAGATLTASGASTYSWTPTTGLSSSTTATVIASPAATTIYTVTGTDVNGCKGTASRTVQVLGLPTIFITPLTATSICEGTSVSLSAFGAVTYTWAPAASLSASTGTTVTASPITTTTYTVTGTAANGCQSSATKTVTVKPKPNTTITPGGYINVCAGDTVRLTTTAGYDTYEWQLYGSPVPNSRTNVLATVTGGFYTVKITDTAGCVATTPAPTVITVNPLPVPTITATGGLLSTQPGYSSYQWMLGGLPIPGATGQTYTTAHDGYYSVRVTDTGALHCVGSSVVFYLTALGLQGTPASAVVRIYPNPTNGVLHIDAPAGSWVSVVSMDGKLVYSNQGIHELNISTLADGIYRIVVRDANGGYLKMEKITKVTE